MTTESELLNARKRHLRIARLEANSLFGVFNHTIPFNLDERVTIVQGPNGFGKTVMLRLLAAVFSKRYQTLRSTPFERLSIEFDDGSRLLVTKKEGTQRGTVRKAGPDLVFEYRKGAVVEDLRIPDHGLRRAAIPPSAVEHEIPELERIGGRLWQHSQTGEVLEFDEVIERYPLAWSGGPSDESERKSAWFADLVASVPIHFVEAQRLLVPANRTEPAVARRSGLQQAVTVYASELAATIQLKLADYANLSQSLDRTFPFRVVKAEPSGNLDAEALKSALSLLEQRRRDLRDAGLLDTEVDAEFPVVGEVDDEKRALLDVYVKDSNQKLAVFDDLAGKTELMKKVLNSRFLHKNVEINREDGIRVITRDGRQLLLTALSSGEQHELVLLYELLFRVSEGSLILLDEPELSLHIEWQSAFLDDLIEIANLRYLDVVIATHSPQITGDRLELTVQLQGPAE
jgi:ABC-type transport system involved in cytochrome c biogenesis ATPase subunit